MWVWWLLKKPRNKKKKGHKANKKKQGKVKKKAKKDKAKWTK